MRQGSNSKRPRGKGGNRGGNGARNSLTRSYDSNGPAGRVRGNPHQVHEKYLSLARDMQAEDPVLAENLLQHADHYFRVINEANGRPRRDENRRDDASGDGQESQDGQDDDNRNGQGVYRQDREQGNGAEDTDDGTEPAADRGDGEDDTVTPETAEPAAPPPKRARRPRKPKADTAEKEDVTTDAA